MTKYSSVNFSFEIDKADGGALTVGLTPYITKFGEVNVTKGFVPADVFGSAVGTYLLGVIKRYDPIVLGGFYESGAEPMPDAVFNSVHAVTRTFLITLGGAKTIGGECWFDGYKRTFEVGNYHGYEVTIQATGTINEA